MECLPLTTSPMVQRQRNFTGAIHIAATLKTIDTFIPPDHIIWYLTYIWQKGKIFD